MKTVFLLSFILSGCNTSAGPTPFYLAPFNGQTGVPRDLDLVVHTQTLAVPDNVPLADVLQVVDLTDGGFVAGDVSYFADTIRFSPTQQWKANRRFAWTLLPVENLPHGPEIHFEDALVGTGVFDTSNRLDFLSATLQSDQKACILLSRPLGPDDQQTLTITLDGVEISPLLSELPESEWGASFDLDEGDPGPGVLCIELNPDSNVTQFNPGAPLRIWWGQAGPWHLALKSVSVESLILQARRGER